MDRGDKIRLGLSVFLIVFGLVLIALLLLLVLPASPLYLTSTSETEKVFHIAVMPAMLGSYSLVSLGFGISGVVRIMNERKKLRRREK